MSSSPTKVPTAHQRVYFQHVTKCAGTSLRAALMSALQEQGATPASFYQLEPVKTNAFANAMDIDSIQVRDLLLADRLSKADCRFIAGHFRYTSAVHEALLPSVVSVTVLRDPVDRFLSLYYYNRYKQAEHGKETLPLDVYVTRPKAQRSAEDYVRLFRGTGGDSRAFATADDVEQACSNLDRFSVVGCLEYLPAFLDAVEQASGLVLDLPRLNKSPAPATERYKDLPDELFEEISRLCQPSRQVYEYALQLTGVSAADAA